jgi:SAM-dependent methyltransferase
VKRLRAAEPSRLSVRLAGPRIAASPAVIEIVGLDGQRLPLADDTAAFLLCTWSLCTIPDPVAAVAEMRRVLRPGSTLHFAEHGLAPDDPARHPRSSTRSLPDSRIGIMQARCLASVRLPRAARDTRQALAGWPRGSA